MPSLQGRLDQRTASLKRKLFDNEVRLMGIEADVVRFKVTEDRYGDEVSTVISQDTVTARFSYPGEIPLDRFREGNLNLEVVEDTNTFFFEILPIEAYFQWKDHVERGDIIFHVVTDEQGNKVKILLRVSEVLGSFQTTILWRKAYVAPYNGVVPEEIQTAIDLA